MSTKPAIEQQLYEADFAMWLEDQAQALKERRAAALDWDNLAEEIEGLVKRDRRALKSFLENALLHMLELAHWESEYERNQRQWRVHLNNARAGITQIIEDSPSLKSYLAEILDVAYKRARRDAETIMAQELPQQCRWPLEQVGDDGFYPKPSRAAS